MRKRLPGFIAAVALIGATAIPLIWTALVLRTQQWSLPIASASVLPAVYSQP